MKTMVFKALFLILILFSTAHTPFSPKKHESHNCKIVDTSNSGYTKLKSTNLSDVTINSGFWKERQDVNSKVTMLKLWHLAIDPEKSSALENLKIAAGLSDKKRQGVTWMDAWIYKWIETASYVLSNEPDYIFEGKPLAMLLDEVISIIEMVQEEDGYIATQVQITDINRWDDHMNHELYVMGHLLTAGAIHHRVTGKTNLLNVAEKAGEFMHGIFLKKDPKLAEFPLNPSVIMGAVELYRETKNPKFLELGKMVVDWRGSTWSGNNSRNANHRNDELSDHNQNWRPLREETEVLGHSVFWSYLYAGATDVFLENGDSTLLKKMEELWLDLTTKKMYVNGGVGPEHKALMTRSFKEGERIILLHDNAREGIASPYRLPNSTAYNETCAQVGNMMWNWRMLLATGEAKYADIMELNLYNSVLSGVELDGDGWSYTNPLRWYGHDHELLPNDFHKRINPGFRQICCPTNLMRNVAAYNGYLYTTDATGLQIHHYAASRATVQTDKKTSISFQVKTEYPWDGKIVISLDKISGKSFNTLKLRVPAWAQNVTLKLNGEIQNQPLEPGSYITLNRKWKTGDEVEFNIPFDVQLLVSDHKLESTMNQVAVRRGPIIYCLESNDIPKGKDFFNVYLDQNADWSVIDGDDVLKGFKLLKTKALYAQTRGKNDLALYSRLNKSDKYEQIDVVLIPYFAWNNRDEPIMSIWLPFK